MEYILLIVIGLSLPPVCTFLAFAMASKAGRLRLLHWVFAATVAVCSCVVVYACFVRRSNPLALPCFIGMWLITMLQTLLFLRHWSSRRS